MQQKLSLGFYCLFLGMLGHAQITEPEYTELDQLTAVVHDSMSKHDSGAQNRPSEFIMLFLEIDSSGRVIRINMMTDEKNAGPSLAALRTITPDALERWRSIKYKRKLIVMPVFSPGSKPSVYLDYIDGSPVLTWEQCKVRGEYKFVITPQLYYLWPDRRTSH